MYEDDYDDYCDITADGESCDNCGSYKNVNYYNNAGQLLNFGGFDSDKLLCDECFCENIKNPYDPYKASDVYKYGVMNV